MKSRMTVRVLAPSLLSLCLVVGISSACTPTVVNRGNIPDPDRLAELKIGTSTREDVSTKLGTPTQTGTFDENVWYYYGRTTEQYAFFDPKVINQEAIEVRFDDEGIVKSVQKLAPTTQDVNPVDRRTPTYGHETTFVEQLLGNLGRRVTKDKK